MYNVLVLLSICHAVICQAVIRSIGFSRELDLIIQLRRNSIFSLTGCSLGREQSIRPGGGTACHVDLSLGRSTTCWALQTSQSHQPGQLRTDSSMPKIICDNLKVMSFKNLLDLTWLLSWRSSDTWRTTCLKHKQNVQSLQLNRDDNNVPHNSSQKCFSLNMLSERSFLVCLQGCLQIYPRMEGLGPFFRDRCKA